MWRWKSPSEWPTVDYWRNWVGAADGGKLRHFFGLAGGERDNDSRPLRVHIVVSPADSMGGPAIASLTADLTLGEAPLSVTFDASASRASAGSMVLQYIFLPGSGPALRGILPLMPHRFERPGVLTSELEIWDATGAVVKWQDQWPPLARIRATAFDSNAGLAGLHADVKDVDGVVESVLWTLPDGRTSTSYDVTLHLDTKWVSKW